MNRAIQLAKKGRFTTSPNPNVGCVIVDASGSIVGEGYHQKAGTPHAEVHALHQAGERAIGATAFVTLEPCSHYGRTPPCAQALIDAGVRHVVCAMEDPNPAVSGRGFDMLRKAGITVEVGVLKAQAEAINRGFLTRMRHKRPFVTLKMASSLDGKTALNNGLSQWITGAEARQDVQAHRAASCAILSGSGTVMADNPSLNVRAPEFNHERFDLEESEIRQPARVVLDGRGQMTPELNVWSQSARSYCINSRFNALLPKHVTQWQAPMQSGKIDLTQVCAYLAMQEFNDVWVEAGAKLAGALVKEKLVDELILYQAPKLMGDSSLGLLAFPELTSMHDVIDLQIKDIRQVGKDIKITASLV
ncbi:bifunctional diaminohydroxyphosphoribosylaminopyrimidine deaminase/5-amino-6-(5-phosphoribosylamino)uracil reductase RibD [Aestuariibacter sp. AA17]|uniref:Riboflavin biosynthesis protein RibD n=1 Tax=Fluctibacter corallii TaxID=2984329 RepID=A0ABT3A3J0_9ALTE|nr:bifunctional diaminohydroxyphosphoribosylaminopyrimidine deaminase/5-amino-6-(5-phosphoribosylamino)uracil reductase RibD [Aestuariibacter sp. AA17]MCV2883223.1 bifunctional diaminohydroxyphosphoribosylaminopyrimidine deaminase/5-amino-6-(5-phosphoribosylamino)uracil reductase RibD [Aestuariibacter sp. AA17]